MVLFLFNVQLRNKYDDDDDNTTSILYVSTVKTSHFI